MDPRKMDPLANYLLQVALDQAALRNLLIFYRFDWTPEELWSQIQQLHVKSLIHTQVLYQILVEWQSVEQIPVHYKVVNYLECHAFLLLADYQQLIQRAGKKRDIIPPSPRIGQILRVDGQVTLSSLYAAKDLANHLTLQLRDLFGEITIQDLVENGPTRCRLIDFFNRMSDHITWEIVSCLTREEAANQIDYYLNVGKMCQKMNNFEGLFILMTGINHSLVQRLKQTLRLVRSQKRLLRYGRLFNADKNHSHYRAAIETLTDYLPLFMIVIKDLTMVREIPVTEDSPWVIEMAPTSRTSSSSSEGKALTERPSSPGSIGTAHINVHKIDLVNRILAPLLRTKFLYLDRTKDSQFEKITEEIQAYDYAVLRCNSLTLEPPGSSQPTSPHVSRKSGSSGSEFGSSDVGSSFMSVGSDQGLIRGFGPTSDCLHLSPSDSHHIGSIGSGSGSSNFLIEPDTWIHSESTSDYHGTANLLMANLLDCAKQYPYLASKRDRGRWYIQLHKINPANWSYQDILLWLLHSRANSQLSETVKNRQINGSVIFTLDKEKYTAAGISEIGQVRELIRSARLWQKDLVYYRQEANYRRINKWNKYDVAAWLEDNEMAHLCDIFLANKIDGVKLSKASKDKLKKWGVNSLGDLLVIQRLLKSAVPTAPPAASAATPVPVSEK